MAIKRIGILTGGGDVPGLNSVIKSATYRSRENGIEIFGLRRGWEALTHLNFKDPTSQSHYVLQLNRETRGPKNLFAFFPPPLNKTSNRVCIY
jgi:ATP-dependent phosphofructokinase / diphosphate-dependent phosphofructokinase